MEENLFEENMPFSINHSVDTRGTKSPDSLLEVKKILDMMNPGETLEVLSADINTRNEIAEWCAQQGFVLWGIINAEGFFRLYISKYIDP